MLDFLNKRGTSNDNHVSQDELAGMLRELQANGKGFRVFRTQLGEVEPQDMFEQSATMDPSRWLNESKWHQAQFIGEIAPESLSLNIDTNGEAWAVDDTVIGSIKHGEKHLRFAMRIKGAEPGRFELAVISIYPSRKFFRVVPPSSFVCDLMVWPLAEPAPPFFPDDPPGKPEPISWARFIGQALDFGGGGFRISLPSDSITWVNTFTRYRVELYSPKVQDHPLLEAVCYKQWVDQQPEQLQLGLAFSTSRQPKSMPHLYLQGQISKLAEELEEFVKTPRKAG